MSQSTTKRFNSYPSGVARTTLNSKLLKPQRCTPTSSSSSQLSSEHCQFVQVSRNCDHTGSQMGDAYIILQKESSANDVFLTAVGKLPSTPQTILVQFYTATIESILTSAITVWFDAVSSREKRKLRCTIKTAEKIISCSLLSLKDLYITRTKRRAEKKLINDTSHPANDLLQKLPPGKQFHSFTKTAHHQNSCFPLAISVINQAG